MWIHFPELARNVSLNILSAYWQYFREHIWTVLHSETAETLLVLTQTDCIFAIYCWKGDGEHYKNKFSFSIFCQNCQSVFSFWRWNLSQSSLRVSMCGESSVCVTHTQTMTQFPIIVKRLSSSCLHRNAVLWETPPAMVYCSAHFYNTCLIMYVYIYKISALLFGSTFKLWETAECHL